MDDQPPRRCGAKTRDGDPCKNWAMRPSARCRMHGGKTPVGIASPSYKHGLYSVHLPLRALVQGQRQREEIATRGRTRAAELSAREAAKAAARAARWRRELAAWTEADIARLFAETGEAEDGDWTANLLREWTPPEGGPAEEGAAATLLTGNGGGDSRPSIKLRTRRRPPRPCPDRGR